MGSSSGIGLSPTTNYIGLNLDRSLHLISQVRLSIYLNHIMGLCLTFKVINNQNPINFQRIKQYIKKQKEEKRVLRKQSLGFLAKQQIQVQTNIIGCGLESYSGTRAHFQLIKRNDILLQSFQLQSSDQTNIKQVISNYWYKYKQLQ
ncbi:unnamed protein product [Paramecium octaurelia]|uniref:Uncharacterized protein n=1 Tax=Paramecium octaurelia TaxID=43137 RepID=A0A8S1TZ35_PAROT|nr:unnamed protein product [Paramecium octaurelia]